MPTLTVPELNKARIDSGNLGGRPTVYEEWMPAKALELLSSDEYLPINTVISRLGIDQNTFYRWLKDDRYMEFREHVQKGVAEQEATMNKMMMDRSVATAGVIFAMKNSIHRYRDRIETENTNVNVDTVVSKQGEGVPKISWERKSNDMEVVEAEVVEE